MILGRVQVKAMGYVQFPQIRQPHTLNAFEHTSTKWCAHKTPTTKTAETAPRAQVSVHKTTQKEITKTKQTHQTTEPVLPDIKWGSDYIQLNGKTHQLPITKDYILKEYNDVFKGVGTLPGGPYHIRLKEEYRPVQHPPRSGTHSNANCIQIRVRETDQGGHHNRSQRTHRVDQLDSTSHEIQWQSKTMPGPQRPQQSN